MCGRYVGPSVGTSAQDVRNRRVRGGPASYNFDDHRPRQDTPGNNTACGVAFGWDGGALNSALT